MDNRQQGQVLPIGLVMLALGVMGALVLYNTGQMATDKMTLANTADAAAYSGSQWQARALNFQSYSNRAMVANQVSIAQAVSLQSWVAYGAVASENMATVLGPVPVLNVLASGLETGLTVVEQVMSPVSKAMLNVVDVVNRGLSVSQQAMFVSTFVATPDVVKTIVEHSDERFTINTGFSGLGLANNLSGWDSFTQGFDQQDHVAMSERADLVNQSRDEFTQQRNWKFFENFWYYSTPLLRHRIYREGETRLIQVEGENGTQWEWKAKDTMSLHNKLWLVFKSKRFEIPIGWAEAFANTQNSNQTIEPGACTPSSTPKDCARFLDVNKHSEYFADTGVTSPVKQKETQIAMRGYTGLQAFRSLSEATIQSGVAHLKLKVEVAMPEEQAKSSESLGIGGDFSAPVSVPGGLASSVSVAEVFYQRPDIHDNPDQALEKANGYNPYWSARLATVSTADRALAFSLRPSVAAGSKPDGLPQTPNQLGDYQPSGDAAQSEASGLSDDNFSGFNPYGTDVGNVISQPVADFEAVVASLDTQALGGFKDTIQNELNEVLKDAVKEMLLGAFDEQISSARDSVDHLNDRIEQLANDQVEDLVSSDMVEPYLNVVAEAQQIAEDYKEEFKRIRDQIAEEFGQAVDAVRAELEQKVSAIETQISQLHERLNSASLNDAASEDLRAQIAQRREDIIDVYKDFKEDLAHQLVDIVSEATDIYVMRLDEALYTVTEWLRSEEEEIELPWDDFTDDDDDDI